MNTKRFVTIFILVLGLLLILSVGLSAAQEAQDDPPPLEPMSADAVPVENRIPIQGRLTDAGGSPLHGKFFVTFRVYDEDTGGTSLCDDTHPVIVNNGLFNTTIEGCTPAEINGKQLYLGIEVESDGEMTPRQPLYPVPYAYSLVPGADLRGNLGLQPMFAVENSNSFGGIGLEGFASATSGVNWGVWGHSQSPDGIAGYFQNTASGGVDIKAGGTGIIQSAAKTYLFVPGANFIKQGSSNSTEWVIAGSSAKIYRGSTEGPKTILIPITIPAVLYGQPVRVTQIRVYYKCPEAVDNYITRTRLSKNTDADSYVDLILTADADQDRTSTTADFYTIDTLTAHNLLSANEGFLTLHLDLQFVEDYELIIIGGVRLTLEHD